MEALIIGALVGWELSLGVHIFNLVCIKEEKNVQTVLLNCINTSILLSPLINSDSKLPNDPRKLLSCKNKERKNNVYYTLVHAHPNRPQKAIGK